MLSYLLPLPLVTFYSGCEWLALHQIVTETPEILTTVRMIMMELHVTYFNSKMSPLDQVRLIASFWENYIIKLGFRIWFVNDVVGWEVLRPKFPPNTLYDLLIELGVDSRFCCYEIGLYREF